MASASAGSSVTPADFSPYKQAIAQLEALRAKKRVPDDALDLIKCGSSFSDVLEAVRTTKVKTEAERSAVHKFLASISEQVILRLDRFGRAIDVLAQCSDVAALVWGSLRFVVVVRQLVDFLVLEQPCADNRRLAETCLTRLNLSSPP
jgi:hypothetical protein